MDHECNAFYSFYNAWSVLKELLSVTILLFPERKYLILEASFLLLINLILKTRLFDVMFGT